MSDQRAERQGGFGSEDGARVRDQERNVQGRTTDHPPLSATRPRSPSRPFALPDTATNSPAMRALHDLASRVATVDSTVLILGESGVGKERIARLVHALSPRARGPFLAINCGAVTETLLESELFGHARGAFTGATQDRAGLFESANGGTLLLDEVGDVSPGVQVKLLRTLQEREVRRVGEARSRPIDVRVIAATNRDLLAAVSSANFREDLYYRLKVVELRVPPLRDRKEDILPLAHELLVVAAGRMARRLTGFGPGVGELLLRHTWPGNVRELENAVERAAALARMEEITIEDLPEELRTLPPSRDEKADSVRPLEEIERDYILFALARNRGNQSTTAHQLQIGTATLYRKLKKYRNEGCVPGPEKPDSPDARRRPSSDAE